MMWTTSRRSLQLSTADRARPSGGKRRPRLSTPCCDQRRLALRRPVESEEGTSKPVPYVAADNVAGGRLQGEWVIKNMPNGARVVVINGQLGSSSGMDR